MATELFIGITSSNSARFLEASLQSLRATTSPSWAEIVVLDNQSTDESVEVARRHGVRAHVRACAQAHALNWLFDESRSRLTLLLHADVVMLSQRWFEICNRHLVGSCALVSPMDVGLGPFTRGFSDRPESSFLLFDTRKARLARRWYHTQRFRIHWPWRGLNFYGPHITHALIDDLRAKGLSWQQMQVHTSPRVERPIYECRFEAANWRPEYATYEYGFGNFYSLDGQVTHYHNWYERVDKVAADSTAVHPTDHLPLGFLRTYSERFLADYKAGTIKLPDGDRGIAHA